MFEKTLVAENEVAKFYKNYVCKSIDMRHPDFTCIIGEREDDLSREYILLEKGTPIYTTTNAENLEYRIFAIKKSRE